MNKNFKKLFTAFLLSVFAVFSLVAVNAVGVFADTDTVSFYLIGDDVHGTQEHKQYETWIQDTYTLDGNTTVAELIAKAFDECGFTGVGVDTGYISSVTTVGGVTLAAYDNGNYSGWMYRVNGVIPSVGISDYVVNARDKVELFYLDDYREIYGYGLNINVTPTDSTVVVYDAKGNVVEASWGYYSLEKGTYTYVVSKDGYVSQTGEFTITNDDATITAELEVAKTASFKVVGDSVHGDDPHTAYEDWINNPSYEIGDNTTVADMLIKSLDDNGYTYNYYSSGWLSSITTPDGKELGSYTNSVYSGWMYRVNGVIPSDLINQYVVKEGDEVEVFYLDDYREIYGYGLNINVTPTDSTVVVYDAKGNVVEASWGYYSLEKGTYTYVVSKDGYASQNGEFTITNDDATITADLDLWGDYNKDKQLTAADAAAILQRVLDNSFELNYDTIKIVDVDGNDQLTAADAAIVLQKVLDNSFKMPCEK